MTDRHIGYLVTLKNDIRDDDAKTLVEMLRWLEPVAEVIPIINDGESELAKMTIHSRMRVEIMQAIRELLWPEFKAAGKK